MKISEIVANDAIEVGIKLENKEDLIQKLLELAYISGNILDFETVKSEVFKREEILSTGIGNGIALPHAKTKYVKQMTGAIIVLGAPLDYESLDNEPVEIAVLILGSENHIGQHIRILSKISRLLSNDSFRNQLVEAENKESVMSLLKDYEENYS